MYRLVVALGLFSDLCVPPNLYAEVLISSTPECDVFGYRVMLYLRWDSKIKKDIRLKKKNYVKLN